MAYQYGLTQEFIRPHTHSKTAWLNGLFEWSKSNARGYITLSHSVLLG